MTSRIRRHRSVVTIAALIALASSPLLSGCATILQPSKQLQLQEQVANRQPVDPKDYELTVTTCGNNTVTIPKGAVDVPPGKGYEIGFDITNRSSERQQYEIRFSITSTDGAHTWHPPYLDTNSLDPGETFSDLTQSHVAEAYWNGFTCSLEVWPSTVKIVDDIANGD